MKCKTLEIGLIDNLNTKQGYFDRLLLRGLCDNAKRKGKYGGREKTIS